MSSVVLPEGWLNLRTSEAFTQVSTNGKKTNTKDCQADGLFPVVDQGMAHIAGYINDQDKLIQSKKPLIVFGDHTRVVKWINFSFVAGADGIKILSPASQVDERFFYYQLCSYQLPDKGYARHFKYLSDEVFKLPPLAEQKVIVEKLDELLAQVDILKTRLTTIPKLLKRFRQSVLAAAVSGKLTEEWRKEHISTKKIELEDIQKFWQKEYEINTKKFRTSKLAPVLPMFELPESWQSTQLGVVFDVYVGATPSRSEDSFWGGSVNWVSSSEVAFCRIKTTKETITEKGLSNSSTNVHPAGTVMLAMIGQGKTRGQPAILDVSACHNQNTAALRIPNGFALSEFLYYFLAKQYEETRTIGGGNNQQALNKLSVQSLPFPLPPLEEQTEIVRRVEQLFAFADQIEKQVKNAQSRVNNLTQSILAKAFRGELSIDWRAANPHLISGENSAQALLDKIKAERGQKGKRSN